MLLMLSAMLLRSMPETYTDVIGVLYNENARWRGGKHGKIKIKQDRGRDCALGYACLDIPCL